MVCLYLSYHKEVFILSLMTQALPCCMSADEASVRNCHSQRQPGGKDSVCLAAESILSSA